MIKMYHLIIVIVMMTSCSTEVVKETTENHNKEESLHPIKKEMNLEKSTENTYKLFSFQIGENFVSMSPLPGKVNLSDDIAAIKAQGITNVVTLVSKEELVKKNLTSFIEEMNAAGLEVYHSPIVDFGLPSENQMDSIMAYVQSCIDNNKNVLIHCMGGYGRSGTVMGCYAQRYLNVEDPLQYVRDIRGGDAIETKEQETFVLNY
jgi:protein-tyrosine phosphatase